MAPRVPASFFQAREVALVGYSKRHAAFCSEIKTRLEALALAASTVAWAGVKAEYAEAVSGASEEP